MYERFTDRARKLMQLAHEEALRRNHEYIGTEHILLGLVAEGTGIAVAALHALGVNLADIRGEVERLVQNGPDLVTKGKLPQTPRAKRVIQYSMEEARDMSHNYVGTEHILIALVRESEGVGGRALANLGQTLVSVREAVGEIMRDGTAVYRGGHDRAAFFPAAVPVETIRSGLRARIDQLRQRLQEMAARLGRLPERTIGPTYDLKGPTRQLAPRAQELVVLAEREAAAFNHEYIGTEHLLLALTVIEDGGTTKVLQAFGIDRPTVRNRIERLTGARPKMATPGRRLSCTPRVMQVLAYAVEEAGRRNREMADTEDILLGLLREDQGVASHVLFDLGISLKEARTTVRRLSDE